MINKKEEKKGYEWTGRKQKGGRRVMKMAEKIKRGRKGRGERETVGRQ